MNSVSKTNNKIFKYKIELNVNKLTGLKKRIQTSYENWTKEVDVTRVR